MNNNPNIDLAKRKPLSFFQCVKAECEKLTDNTNRKLAALEADIAEAKEDLAVYQKTIDQVDEIIEIKTIIVKKTEGLIRHEYKGEMLTIRELTNIATNGADPTCLYYRLKRGWEVVDAITTPVRARRYA